MKGFRNGLGLAWAALTALPVAFAAEAPSSGVVMPTVNCQSMMAELDRKIQNDDAYKPVREALRGDPNQKCQLNRAADHDKNYGLRGQQYRRNTQRECTDEDQSLCLATYARIRSTLDEYKKMLKKGCEIAGGAGQKCATASSEPERFRCVARELREAAKAEKEAHTAITQAGKDAAEYHRLTTELSGVYTRDRTIISRFSGEDLTTATAIRNGQIDRAAPEGGLLQQLRDRETVGAPTAGSTITGGTVLSNFGGAQNLQTYYQNAERLASEQKAAADAARGFRGFAEEEASYRERSQQTLLQMANENELRATRTITNPDGRTTTGPSKISGTTNSTGGSTLGQMQQAMQLTQATAGLNNAVNGNPNAGATQAAAPSMWENVTGAVQNITGLGGGGGPGSSKLGGDNVAKGGGTQPGPGEGLGSPKADGPGRHDLPGSFGVASNGDTFVTGLGDLPESGAASRTPAAARGKPGEGLGADVKGTKKRRGEPGAEKAACPPDQDCSALAATGSAFNKGGSLGVPLVGAADPNLNVKGALDGLFGELPTLDANGNPTAPLAAGDAGFGFAESELGVDVGQAAGGQQGSPEVAPANSRTLFARVRGAHEKALKKGAVSLFHKKL